MTLNNSMFGFSTFKILVQIQNPKYIDEFESYLCSLKNIKHFRRMLGLWDYEIDLVFPNIEKLHKQLELIKVKFPGIFKKVGFVSFGKRIVTNNESFLD